MTNAEIIRKLRREAAAMARAGENLYRVRAYRQAALRLSGLPRPIAECDPDTLKNAGLGDHLSKTILEWAAR